ncbi:MAG: M20/M25/M40 family metallo-hydrolase, partial [Candidatus Sumerlaeia bacterium]|nr:M20/M25/M40 family metallo-hydrolase [Candidatus Sumerlaeia bacterium]
MTSPFSSLLKSHLDRLAPELLADSQRIIQFKTVSGGSPEEEATLKQELPRCFEWLRTRAEAFGFEYREFEGRVGEIAWNHPNGDGAPLVVVAGHIDVVTPGTGNWTHPAFGGEVHDGELWGRGTQDDKVPTLQALYAMRALKEAGVQLPFNLRLVVG